MYQELITYFDISKIKIFNNYVKYQDFLQLSSKLSRFMLFVYSVTNQLEPDGPYYCREIIDENGPDPNVASVRFTCNGDAFIRPGSTLTQNPKKTTAGSVQISASNRPQCRCHTTNSVRYSRTVGFRIWKITNSQRFIHVQIWKKLLDKSYTRQSIMLLGHLFPIILH